jgi:hypothetical protein
MSVSFTCAFFGICLVNETCILRRHGGELYFVDDWVCTRKLEAVNLKILVFNSSTFKIMECPGKQQAFWLLVHKICTKHTRIYFDAKATCIRHQFYCCGWTKLQRTWNIIVILTEAPSYGSCSNIRQTKTFKHFRFTTVALDTVTFWI